MQSTAGIETKGGRPAAPDQMDAKQHLAVAMRVWAIELAWIWCKELIGLEEDPPDGPGAVTLQDRKEVAWNCWKEWNRTGYEPFTPARERRRAAHERTQQTVQEVIGRSKEGVRE